MKLFFYKFSTCGAQVLEIGESDVNVKRKTYRPIYKFPRFYNKSYVHKEDVGHLSGHRNDTVILLEPNKNKAIDLFMQKHKKKLEQAMQIVELEKAKIEYLEKEVEE